MLESVAALIIYTAESFTGSVLENSSITATCGSRDVDSDIH